MRGSFFNLTIAEVICCMVSLVSEEGPNLKQQVKERIENTCIDITTLVALVPMKEKDVFSLFNWVQQSHVLCWWHDVTDWESFVQKYTPQMLALNYVYPFIIEAEGRAIGYIQYYLADKSDDGFWFKHVNQPIKTMGIDILIGDVSNVGRGYGTYCVKLLIEKIFSETNAEKIIIDPHPKNIQAIRCYEKAGFRKEQELETIYGPAFLMSIYRANR